MLTEKAPEMYGRIQSLAMIAGGIAILLGILVLPWARSSSGRDSVTGWGYATVNLETTYNLVQNAGVARLDQGNLRQSVLESLLLFAIPVLGIASILAGLRRRPKSFIGKGGAVVASLVMFVILFILFNPLRERLSIGGSIAMGEGFWLTLLSLGFVVVAQVVFRPFKKIAMVITPDVQN